MTTKIYVASSWRNQYQPEVVKRFRAEGFAVYDFRNPAPDDHGFHWSEIDPAWKDWSPEKYRDALRHPVAVDGFTKGVLVATQAERNRLAIRNRSGSHQRPLDCRSLGVLSN